MTEKTVPERVYEGWQRSLDTVFEGKSRKKRLLLPAIAAIYTALGALFCARALPFTGLSLGVPLADAFVCSAGAYAPFALLGALLGAIRYGQAGAFRYITLGLLAIARLITGRKRRDGSGFFSEAPLSKTASAAVVSLILTALLVLKSGVSADTVKAALATMLTLPTLTVIMSVYFMKPTEGRAARGFYELSALFLFSCAVWCADGIRIAFCSVSTLLAVFLTLCVSKSGGFARGAVTALTLGYIATPQYFPAIVALGAVSALLFSFGVFSACGISATVACACAALIEGPTALLGFIPDLVTAVAITSPILRYGLLPDGFPYPSIAPVTRETGLNTSLAALSHLSLWKELSELSERLRSLGKGIAEIAEGTKKMPDTEEAVGRVRGCVCESCAMELICHESERQRAEGAISELMLACAGEPESASVRLPEYLASHCVRLHELTLQAKKEARSLSVPRVTHTEPLLLSCSGASAMLEGLARQAETELTLDTDAEKSIASALFSIGLPFHAVSVIGSTRKRVLLYGADRKRLKKALPKLHDALRSVLGSPYLDPTYGEHPDSPAVFLPATRLSAEIALASACKEGEKASGDTAISFNDGEGRAYAVIADGMGSGENAERSSSLTAEMIKSLVTGGVDGATAVRLTHGALKSLGNECFSTVDLIRLDLVSCAAVSTKSHACPSFLLRSGSVYACSASTLPIGITDEITPEETGFQIADGDIILMVSDGVTGGDDSALRDILGLCGSLDAQDLADAVLSRFTELRGRQDDMSVLVIKLARAA